MSAQPPEHGGADESYLECTPSCSVLFTVGNELRGDDGAGPFLARMLETDPLRGWHVIDGSSVPENHVHAVRRLRPGRVVVVDAADMGIAPGEIRLIDEDEVGKHFLMTTHSLPLSFVLSALKESVPQVDFLGVQPKETSFFAAMTTPVHQAVEKLYGWIRDGANLSEFSHV